MSCSSSWLPGVGFWDGQDELSNHELQGVGRSNDADALFG